MTLDALDRGSASLRLRAEHSSGSDARTRMCVAATMPAPREGVAVISAGGREFSVRLPAGAAPDGGATVRPGCILGHSRDIASGNNNSIAKA